MARKIFFYAEFTISHCLIDIVLNYSQNLFHRSTRVECFATVNVLTDIIYAMTGFCQVRRNLKYIKPELMRNVLKELNEQWYGAISANGIL